MQTPVLPAGTGDEGHSYRTPASFLLFRITEEQAGERKARLKKQPGSKHGWAGRADQEGGGQQALGVFLSSFWGLLIWCL